MIRAIVTFWRRHRDRSGWTSSDYARRGLWPPYEVTLAEARAHHAPGPAHEGQDYHPGGLVRGSLQLAAKHHGLCPLDGFPLIEFEPLPPFFEHGSVEHIIPAAWAPRALEAYRKISEAHAPTL